MTIALKLAAFSNSPPFPRPNFNPLFPRSNTACPIRPVRASVSLSPHPTLIPCSDDEPKPLFSAILSALRVPAMLAFLTASITPAALAASGGRMGGTNFSSYPSSSSSSSSSSPSSSYSSSSSYGSSSSSYSSSQSQPSSSSESYSYSISQEQPRPSSSSESYSYSISQEPPWAITSGDKVFLYSIGGLVVAAIAWFVVESRKEALGPGITVHKIQVGLLGMGRGLQKNLDHIADIVDTSTSEGLHFVMTETALALLRYPDCCISAYSSADFKQGREDGEKEFGRLSMEERAKFDEETLVNSNNIKRKKRISRGRKIVNEYIVVTILVAVLGKHKLPVINGSADLKEALQRLGSIASNMLLGVEVLWTPQNENDTLTEHELHRDYPLLRSL